MSIMQQPQTPQKSPEAPMLKALLAREWQHLLTMPGRTLTALTVASIIALLIDPLLPLAAFALQWWATSSWTWRDRWASITALAKQGGLFVMFLVVWALLSQAHLWIVPDLTALVQALWRAHLPDDLTLWPPGPRTLLARTLLLLPLAPALALLYEHLDPRTQWRLVRVLTPADLESPKAPVVPPEQPPPPLSPSGTPAPSKARRARHPKRASPATSAKSTQPAVQQMTIDTVLAAAPAPASNQDKGSARPKRPKQTTQSQAPAPSSPPPKMPINWDEVAE